MKSIDGRLNKLENRFGISKSRPMLVLIVGDGRERGLDDDTCVQILHESGFPPAGQSGIINLCQIPAGLNAKETERFVRENGAKICGGGLPRIAR